MQGAALVVGAMLSLAWPSGAAAQLIPGLPPILPPGGPSQEVPSGGGEWLAYGGNASRTGAATETEVFGPLVKVWRHSLGQYPHEPLVVGDLVIVRTSGGPSGTVRALRAADGKVVWEHQTGHFEHAIAANSTMVFVASASGSMTALDVATGGVRWTRHLEELDSVGAPVADEQGVYVAGREFLVGLKATDGSTLFTREHNLFQYGLQAALDNKRVFLAEDCNSALAYDKITGAELWEHREGGGGCDGRVARVFGGAVYTPNGTAYDAVTGDVLAPGLGLAPTAFSGGLGYLNGGYRASAVTLPWGQPVWERDLGGDVLGNPIVVGPTVYVINGGRVVGLGAGSGQDLSATKEILHSFSDEESLLAAGAGLLLAVSGGELIAFAPVLRPPPDGISVAATGFDFRTGKKVVLGAGVGTALRPSRPGITLVDNPAVGKTRRVRDPQSLEDGTSYFKDRLKSNTRYTMRIAGVSGKQARESFSVFAYAKLGVPYARAVSRRTAAVKGVVKKAKPGALKGRTLVAYYGPRKSRLRTRLGTARLKTAGRGAAAAKIRFRIPSKLGRDDVLMLCVKNLPQAGYGRDVGFARTCGKRKVKLPREKAAAPQPSTVASTTVRLGAKGR